MDVNQRREYLTDCLNKVWRGSDWESDLLKKLGYSTISKNFQHIINNLLTSWHFALDKSKQIEFNAESALLEAQHHRELHDTYISLLLDFPNYSKAENYSEYGFFPELPKVGVNSLEKYILGSQKTLRGLD